MDYAVATLMGQYSPMIYTKLPDAIAEGSIGRNLITSPPRGFKALRVVMSSAYLNMDYFHKLRLLHRMDGEEGVKDSVYPNDGLPSRHWMWNNNRRHSTIPDTHLIAIYQENQFYGEGGV